MDYDGVLPYMRAAQSDDRTPQTLIVPKTKYESLRDDDSFVTVEIDDDDLEDFHEEFVVNGVNVTVGDSTYVRCEDGTVYLGLDQKI